jgi:hypothetical protein
MGLSATGVRGVSPPDAGIGAGMNGAVPPPPPRPEWFEAVWQRMDATRRWMLEDPWNGDEINYRGLTEACVRMFHSHGLTLDQIVRAAEFFPESFGRLPTYCALINELWSELLHEQAKAEAPKRLAKDLVKLLSIQAWLERQIPEPDQLLGEVLTTAARMFLVGRTGLGKTLLGFAIACGMATGEGFLHWRCKKAVRVLLIDGEMPEGLIKARAIDAMRRVEKPPIPANLVIYSRYLEDEFSRICPDIGPMPPLNSEEGNEWVPALIDALGGVDVVIFDNVMSLITGDQKDEVSWSGVMPLVQELTRRNIAQLWLDHTGHNTDRQYGSSTKAWPFDSVGVMAPLKDDQCVAREVAFTLSFDFPGKARRRTPDNWHDFETCIIRLKDDRWTSEPVNKDASKIGKVAPSREPYYDALLAAVAKSSDAGPGRTSLSTWTQECLHRGLIEPPTAGGKETWQQRDARQKQFRTAKSDLITAKWIAVEDELVIDLKARWK